jgi:hypothetical protein
MAQQHSEREDGIALVVGDKDSERAYADGRALDGAA